MSNGAKAFDGFSEETCELARGGLGGEHGRGERHCRETVEDDGELEPKESEERRDVGDVHQERMLRVERADDGVVLLGA